MRHDIMQRLQFLAEGKAGLFSRMALASFRNDLLSLDRLEQQLAHYGLVVRERKAEHGFWVEILDEARVLRAQSYSQTRDDALAYAVWGAVREEHAAQHVDTQLRLHNLQAGLETRQKLASRYIMNGDAALRADLIEMKG